MTDFSRLTSPIMGDLEDRFVAVEGSILVLLDGSWVKWTPGFSGSNPGVYADLQADVYLDMTPVVLGSPVSISTSGTAVSLGSIVLTAGYNWEVSGHVGFTALTGTDTVTSYSAAINTSSTFPTNPNLFNRSMRGGPLSFNITQDPTPLRVDASAGSVTVYLLAQLTWTPVSGTFAAFGTMQAKRRPKT